MKIAVLSLRTGDDYLNNFTYLFLFFSRYNDPSYVKVKKLELLTEVCTVDNVENIVSELA